MKRHVISILILALAFAAFFAVEELITMSSPGVETRYFSSTGEERFPSLFKRITEAIFSAGVAALLPGLIIAMIVWPIVWKLSARIRHPRGWRTYVFVALIGLFGVGLLSFIAWLIFGGWAPPALLGFAATGSLAVILALYVRSHHLPALDVTDTTPNVA